jgi:uncharacterized membrane protein YgcG
MSTESDAPVRQTRAVQYVMTAQQPKSWADAKTTQYNGKNYREWRDSLEAAFGWRDASELLEREPEAGEASTAKKALLLLKMSVPMEHRDFVRDAKSPLDAFERLKDAFHADAKARVGALQRELVSLRYDKREGAAKLVTRARNLRSDIAEFGGDTTFKLTDEALVQLILQALPETFQGLKLQHAVTPYSLPAVYGALVRLDHLAVQDPADQGQAHFADGSSGRRGDRGRGGGGHGGGRGRDGGRGGGGRGGRDGDRQRVVTCYYCRKPGHIKRNCHQKAADEDAATRTNGGGGTEFAALADAQAYDAMFAEYVETPGRKRQKDSKAVWDTARVNCARAIVSGTFGDSFDFAEHHAVIRASELGLPLPDWNARRVDHGCAPREGPPTAAAPARVVIAGTPLVGGPPVPGPQALAMVAEADPADQAEDVQLILDSGATRHMVNDEHLLTDLRPASGASVRFADGHEETVTRVGTLRVRAHVGSTIQLIEFRDVLLCPMITKNLLSVNIIVAAGGQCEVSQQGCVLRKGAGSDQRTLALFKYRGDLLVLCGEPVIATSALFTEFQLQHERAGHCPAQVLQDMQHAGLLPSTPAAQVHCEPCVLGKQRAASHPTRPERAAEPLALLHGDLQGPFEEAGLDGERYLLVVVDDYSRFGTVVPLVSKNDAASDARAQG